MGALAIPGRRPLFISMVSLMLITTKIVQKNKNIYIILLIIVTIGVVIPLKVITVKS